MKLNGSTFLRNTVWNAGYFGLAVLAFLGFTVIYTRQFGVEQYGTFSFLLNTVTALISLGAYEGFLITHSLTQSRWKFDEFNRRYFVFNAGLMIIAALIFAIISGRFDPFIVIFVAGAIYLDYRSQSSIAVLITHDDNWKIRACRTLYQILLVSCFLVLRYAGFAPDLAFALSVITAATANYTLLYRNARAVLPDVCPSGSKLSDVEPRVLTIAITSNLATVLALLLDKVTIRLFDTGGDYEIGLYFLFFDLATRAEALYLLISVPVTNHLYLRAQSGELARRDIAIMIAGSVAIGILFAIASYLFVPLIYDVSLEGLDVLPWLFGLYVVARGIRYIVKAVCNATGLHLTLMLSNYLVFIGGALLLLLALWSGGGAISVAMIAGLLATAHLLRAPILAKVMTSRSGIGEPMKLGVV